MAGILFYRRASFFKKPFDEDCYVYLKKRRRENRENYTARWCRCFPSLAPVSQAYTAHIHFKRVRGGSFVNRLLVSNLELQFFRGK